MNTDNRVKLLQYLINNNDFVPSIELQTFLNVSRRSVINYINDVNAEYGDLIVSSQKGYRVTDKHLATELMKKQETMTASCYEERKVELLHRIILGNEKISIDDAADSFYISSSLMRSDILRLKDELKDIGLTLRIKNNCISLIGPAKTKRQYILSLLNGEIEQNHFNLNSLQYLFSKVDVKIIKTIVIEALDEFDFFLDDYSLLNYVLHLSIAVETMTDGSYDSNEQSLSFYSERILKIIRSIHTKLQKELDIPIPFSKILDASVLMSTRVVSKDINKMTYSQIKEIIGEQTVSLIDRIVNNVHEIYGIDLKDDNFLVRFSFHIRNLVSRSSYQIDLPSNQFVTIKDDYPFLYLIAQYVASIISQETQNPLSEVEISYIALHLGVMMEEKSVLAKKIGCAIVIYDYYNSGKLLFNKLSNEINGLNLITIVNSYEQILPSDNIDLVITTLPVDPSIDIPTVKINMIPTKADYLAINDVINELRNSLSTKELERKIRKLFKKELFYCDRRFADIDEVFASLCEKMTSLNYIDARFYESLYTHEEIMSSAYKNIALPHSLDLSSDEVKESCIATIISEIEIDWTGTGVNFVFMLALRKEDRSLFQEVIELLTSKINSEKNQQKLLKIKKYDDLIRFLTESES